MRIAICATILIYGFVLPGQTRQSEAVAQREPQGPVYCGWIGVTVSPMTTAFADSLGMAEPYGAIFGQPEPGSPAAAAGIGAGDVVTAINGEALRRSSNFAPMISKMSPGFFITLTTYRNGELIEVRLMLGSSKCPQQPIPTPGPAAATAQPDSEPR